MKFDPTNWHEVSPGEVIDLFSGNVRVNCSLPSSLFVCLLPLDDEPEPLLPVFVLAGYGTTFDVDVGPGGPVRFYIDGPSKCRAFFWQVPVPDRPARLGSFTNPDRYNDMSSEAYDAVYGEVRRMQHEMRMAMQGFQREARRKAERDAKDRQRVDAVPPPKDEDVVDEELHKPT